MWVYSPASAYSRGGVDSILAPTSPEDSEQSATSSSTNERSTPCAPGSPTEKSTTPPSGTTSRPSTGAHGLDSWMLSLAASRAKMSHQPASAEESKRERGRASGTSLEESSLKWDPDSSLWRTSQGSLLEEESEPYSEPWTSWGMMRGGKLYLPQTSELLISDKESGLLPTPSASEAFHGGKQYLRATETWEDCSCLTAKAIGMALGLKGRQQRPSGKYILDPLFTEWLMGWPIGHTELSSAEMELYRSHQSPPAGDKSKKSQKRIWP